MNTTSKGRAQTGGAPVFLAVEADQESGDNRQYRAPRNFIPSQVN